ncbi:WD repeat-containing protein 53 [Poecilia reticulata]|uniref:WD repeat domain 53 n=1 Tax=Poecilia reticulata TaxID=8081 RepID=A0A3P9MX63_POERE|nr:PREDICTED: WD repeat-containing protein 53 [Poecilia reticulata]
MGSLWCEGHSSSILCVGASPGPEGLIASGAEGGEVTVWTREGSVVGRLALPGQEDVTSAAFSPAVSAHLYVSHGDTVSVFDPRSLKGPVEDFRGAGEEEINAIALNETGSNVAVADDSGVVRILEIPGGKMCRSLRRHTNICSSVAFRPHRPNNLVSVGLDMQVILWGLQKTRPLWTLNLQEAAEEEGDQQQRPGQLFNPPLAHCVSVSGCGNVLGCAAEDGRVHLMRIGGGSKLEQQGAIKAHSQGASQAHFMSFLSHPHWMVTGGNDGLVALWDLSKHPVVNPEAPQRRKGKSGRRRREQEKLKQKADEEDEAAAKDQESPTEEETTSGPKLSISHGDKVNWLCPAVLKGEPSVIVADQSTNLTVYPLSQL